MSRIGKQPIPLPPGVTTTVTGQALHVTGPRGELDYTIHPAIAVAVADRVITCTVKRGGKNASALWGTTRARIANLVHGVSLGFRTQLELHGVGYRAALKGKNLELSLGFSHPVAIPAPAGITFSVEKEVITIEGTDTVQVGQVAANIRSMRKPEPYKGKGVRYVGEKVRRKVGKVVGTTT